VSLGLDIIIKMRHDAFISAEIQNLRTYHIYDVRAALIFDSEKNGFIFLM